MTARFALKLTPGSHNSAQENVAKMHRPTIKANSPSFGETDDTGLSRPEEAVDFDYAAIDASLGEGETETPPVHQRPGDPQGDIKNELMLELILKWFNTPKAEKYFGKGFRLKLQCLGWVSNPSNFEGKSLAQLAAEAGVTPQALSKHTALASRIFGIRNRSQRAHGSRFKEHQPQS